MNLGISRGQGTALALVSLLLLSAVGGAVGASVTALDWSDKNAPDRYLQEDSLTIAEHDQTTMSGALEYESDDGSVAELPAEFNSTKVAPIGVSVEKINESSFVAFPRVSGEGDNNVTWTEASEWSTSTTGTASVSVSSSSPAGNVDAITVDATVSGSDSANATYSNFSISSDAAKRVGQVGANVDTLGSGAVVDVRFYDTDGDYVAFEVNASADADADGVIANATGEGWIEQQRLGGDNMTVEGSGDGTLSTVDKIAVHTEGANAKVELFWLDSEKKSETTLGTHYSDDSDADALRQETETVTDKDFAGELRLSEMGDLSAEFDSATIFDKKLYDVEYRLEYVSADDMNLSVSDAENYPSFDKEFTGYYTLEVPAPIDVSHGSISLMASRGGLPNERFETLEYKVGVSDSTDMHNVTGWSSHSFSSDDAEQLATGISAGDNVVVHDVILYTDAEWNALTSIPAAAGGPVGSGSGGFLGGIINFLTTLPGMIVGGTVGFLGLRRFFGGA